MVPYGAGSPDFVARRGDWIILPEVHLCHLDAVEWTPDPQVPSGGNKEWYSMYRKILEAGKSVWIAHVAVPEIAPLLDAIGTEGVSLTVPP